MDTQEIIQRCKKGDEKAFEFLIDMFADMAFRLAFRIVNDQMEAEDIVQESFISAWENIKKFSAERSFSSWLYRIVINKCYDSLRKRKKRRFTEPAEPPWHELCEASDDPEMILSNKETEAMVRVLSEKLSPKQKLVFILIDLEGLSHDEVVEITGMKKSVLKSNLNHARRNIGEKIKANT